MIPLWKHWKRTSALWILSDSSSEMMTRSFSSLALDLYNDRDKTSCKQLSSTSWSQEICFAHFLQNLWLLAGSFPVQLHFNEVEVSGGTVNWHKMLAGVSTPHDHGGRSWEDHGRRRRHCCTFNKMMIKNWNRRLKPPWAGESTEISRDDKQRHRKRNEQAVRADRTSAQAGSIWPRLLCPRSAPLNLPKVGSGQVGSLPLCAVNFLGSLISTQWAPGPEPSRSPRCQGEDRQIASRRHPAKPHSPEPSHIHK